MHRMFPTEKQTRRRLWRMSEKVRGHQLTRARGCPMTTGDIFMPAIQILHQVLQVGEPWSGKRFFVGGNPFWGIVCPSPPQLLKHQNCIPTPAAVPVRSIKQRGHPKLLGWSRMWMWAIVGHSPPSQRPHLSDWLLSSLNLFCLLPRPSDALHYFWLPLVSVYIKGCSRWESVS